MNRMPKLVLVIVGCTLTSMVLLLSGTQHASAAGGLAISPTFIDEEMQPGASLPMSIDAVDQSPLPISYSVYATPYSVSGENYSPSFVQIPNTTNVTQWFSFPSTAGTLLPGQQTGLNFTLTVPKGTPGGSYTAAVFVEMDTQGSNGLVLRQRVGCIVYLNVAGNVVERGTVATWQTPWLQQGPLTATVKLSNTGSVHYQSKVNVSIQDIFGGRSYAFNLLPEILPQKLRKVDIVWKGGGKYGLYKVSGTATIFGQVHVLPTKYVFVASTSMRILTVFIVLSFIVVTMTLGWRTAWYEVVSNQIKKTPKGGS